MHNVRTVFRREFASYFATPLALVFTIIFLVLTGGFTFFLRDFYQSGQADLQPFFSDHPILFLFLMPALTMGLWSEERKSGNIELLMTLPIALWQAVVGKFLAAWAFAGLVLMLTFPIWITVNYLGNPDNGVIVAAYFGSFLTMGAFLAIGCCLSAASRSQVIAFIFTVVTCLLLLLCGLRSLVDAMEGVLPQTLIDAVASLSFLTHFYSIAKGVIDLRDLLYFGSLIGVSLAATAIVLDMKKAN
jgi:ABC-2 type transport system permease protein